LYAVMALAGCGRFGFDEVPATGDGPAAPDGATGVRGPGTWTATPASPLAARVWTSAVWTGVDYMVFGGALDAAYAPTDTGARFDPATMQWQATPTAGAPPARHTAKLVLVDGAVVEYGGGVGFGPTGGGARFDPVAGAWGAIDANAAPGSRIYAMTIAAGNRVFVWGGWRSGSSHLPDGFVYDPMLDGWTPVATANAPAGRSFASVVWTGTRALVWGGCSGGMPSCATVYGDGASYDPALDAWTPMSSVNAPTPRAQATAVWTGSEMFVFGGAQGPDESMPANTGALYSPATDSWRPISTVGAPSPRVDPAAVMLGDKVFLWGDDAGKTDGFLYDPATDTWSPIAQSGAPSPRSRFAFATNGTSVFVWGGSFTSATGAVWTPEP
jgi:hypothetical protein